MVADGLAEAGKGLGDTGVVDEDFVSKWFCVVLLVSNKGSSALGFEVCGVADTAGETEIFGGRGATGLLQLALAPAFDSGMDDVFD